MQLHMFNVEMLSTFEKKLLPLHVIHENMLLSTVDNNCVKFIP